ncbi:peptide ABC transporter ATP-binding protein [Oryzibacter oryziterrae]|uniref:peptide ABC transporter ATP-binding protein n=1 Tax=Oryzibacter oryziterrae TaxID=2766474 RepID=UPI001F2DCF3F|nr:peptide ABC transporter ATP-binding protein [Oryzibacter oryziterrae]
MNAPVSPEIVLEGRNLARHYVLKRGTFAEPATVRALADATFSLEAGKTLAVVGESGCGKSTLARLVTMIEAPTAGELRIDGKLVPFTTHVDKELRRKVQIIFQDPYGSLNPRQKVGTILEEPLRLNTSDSAAQRQEKARAMMTKVGLRPEHYDRYPHMFSGGQRQRIAIARALMLNPKILVLDEPVSALDVSIQAQVLNLLSDLQKEFGLAYLFISHDLSVVRHIADDVMVMYLGRPVEFGPAADLFANPRHPYTRALLSATPTTDPDKRSERIRLTGELPSPLRPPSGCAFHPRCPFVFNRCDVEMPQLKTRAGNVTLACHGVEEERI